MPMPIGVVPSAIRHSLQISGDRIAIMDELEALRAQLQQVQETDIVQRLSERNCVQIVLKLLESRRIQLVFSTTGKEVMTPGVACVFGAALHVAFWSLTTSWIVLYSS